MPILMIWITSFGILIGTLAYTHHHGVELGTARQIEKERLAVVNAKKQDNAENTQIGIHDSLRWKAIENDRIRLKALADRLAEKVATLEGAPPKVEYQTITEVKNVEVPANCPKLRPAVCSGGTVPDDVVRMLDNIARPNR
jgi:hypothetical protein